MNARVVGIAALIACAVPCYGCGRSDDQVSCGQEGPICAPAETCFEELSLCAETEPEVHLWDGSTPAFREATAAWGLEDIGVQGVRILSVDYDGDGRSDLLVRRGGPRFDDFSDGGTRHHWLLRNTGNGFEDETAWSGLFERRSPAGFLGRPGDVFAAGDVDNDGDMDFYAGLGAGDADEGETSELLLNAGDGTFRLGPADSPLRMALEPTNPAGATFVDINRDGNLDLFVAEGSSGSPLQDRLFIGDGQGGFVDETEARGLQTEDWISVESLNGARAHSNAWSSAACDLNNDGWPELLAASYGRAPNHLWLNDEGRYLNRSLSSGYASDDATDWTDNESARCWCALHPEDDECAGVPAPQYIACQDDGDALRWTHANDREPFRLGGNSGATLCADLNNDGHLDLLTAEIHHWDVGASSDSSEILVNIGAADPRFERPGNAQTGLTRGSTIPWDHGDITASTFDFDNDGRLDVYVGATDYPGNHGLLFHQRSDLRFEEVPVDVGIDHNRSHGSAIADFDRDGDMDIVVGHSRSRCSADDANNCYETTQVRLFENVAGDRANSLQVVLVGGAGSNRAGIGARVEVTSSAGTQVREIGGGHGHYGMQDELVAHFGLGSECSAEVRVRWPDLDGSTTSFTAPCGYRFTVPRQGPIEAVRY